MGATNAEDTALSARTPLRTAESTIGSAPMVMGGDAWWQVLHVHVTVNENCDYMGGAAGETMWCSRGDYVVHGATQEAQAASDTNHRNSRQHFNSSTSKCS